MGTTIVLSILLVCCFIGVRSTIKRIAHGCCGGGSNVIKQRKPADTDISHYPYTYHIKVEGMTCGSCKKRVENALNAVEGVYATVHLRKKTAEIHSKKELDQEKIFHTIAVAGYQAHGFQIV